MAAPTCLREELLNAWPLAQWNEDSIVVAVSGGADSTALLHVIKSLRHDPSKTIVAHFNHGLRGSESDGDQHFVEAMSMNLGLRCNVEVASAPQRENRSENHLRNLRRSFLVGTAEKWNASWIVLAHHADDQVETFLHHLLRGSGPRGLSGMRSSRVVTSTIQLIRPFLHVSRKQILQHLMDRQITYRTDASNAVCDYTRNRIRHELLPMLRAFAGNESLDERLLQACNLIAEQHATIANQANAWLNQKQLESGGQCLFEGRFETEVEPLQELEWPMLKEVFMLVWHECNWPLREMNLRHWRRLQQVVLRSKTSPHPWQQQLPGGIIASYRQGTFYLSQSLSENRP